MQAKPGPRYPVSFASVHPFVAALLSACILNCAGCSYPPWPSITIAKDLDRVRSANSIKVSVGWDYSNELLMVEDRGTAERVNRVKSELCRVFADAVRLSLPNSKYYLCECVEAHSMGSPGWFNFVTTESESRSPLWLWTERTPGSALDSRAQDIDVKLEIHFGIRFPKDGAILEEQYIRFRPPINELSVEDPNRGRVLANAEGGLWTATLKPRTALEVSGKTWKVLNLTGSGQLFHRKAEVDVAQLETALRAWANARAVEVASELAAALRTQPTHE